MYSVILILLLFLSNENYAKECYRIARDGSVTQADITTTDYTTISTLSPESEELEEIFKKSKDSEFAAILISKLSKQASEPRKPFKTNEDTAKMGKDKAYACSKLECPAEDKITPVCACNFLTGNVASFKNKCDSEKHNCRFDTNFKVILDEICPWEFASRRSDTEFVFDYRDPKYYN